MIWQDWVFAVGQGLFAVALIPAILDRTSKPPFFTSLLTAAILAVFAAAFLSLDLWWSALSTTVCSACWWILAWQRISTRRRT